MTCNEREKQQKACYLDGSERSSVQSQPPKKEVPKICLLDTEKGARGTLKSIKDGLPYITTGDEHGANRNLNGNKLDVAVT